MLVAGQPAPAAIIPSAHAFITVTGRGDRGSSVGNARDAAAAAITRELTVWQALRGDAC